MKETQKVYNLATESFTENVNKRVHEAFENIYIAIPAKVVNTDHYESLQCVSVEFSIRDIYTRKNAAILESVTLEKVFVKLHDAGGFKIKSPVSKGDYVTLHWSHKDLGDWLDGDGTSVAQSTTDRASLEDCWVDLGFGTRKDHTNPSKTDLIIEGPNTNITITPTGVITATTSGTSYIKSSHHTIDTDVTITKNLLVQGNTTTDGNVQTGGSTTSQGVVNALAGVYASTYAGVGGGAATFEVDMEINGTVTINGITVNTHTHLDAEGRSTQGPQ